MAKQIPINKSVVKGIGIRGCVVCPACGRAGLYVYEDADGELNYKCPICHRKSIIGLKNLSTKLLDKGSGDVNKSFIANMTIKRIVCTSCSRLAIYAYAGACGHINMKCMHRKCHEKLLVDLDNLSSLPLNNDKDKE